MNSLESLIEPLRHSPRLPEALARLQGLMERERELREQFYAEITSDRKLEFIDGRTVVQAPARNQHLDATMRCAKLLHTYVSLKELGTVKVEKCLCVFPRNDYEPDVVFFGLEKSRTLTPDTVRFPVPDLIVEVLSSSTEENDRGVKFEDYAANGVGEYWLIEPDQQTIEQYLLSGEQYALKTKSSSGVLESRVIPGLWIEIEAVFDERANLAALAKMLSDGA